MVARKYGRFTLLLMKQITDIGV